MRDRLCEVLVNLSRTPPLGQRVLAIVEEELAAAAQRLLEGDILLDATVADAYEASFFMYFTVRHLQFPLRVHR